MHDKNTFEKQDSKNTYVLAFFHKSQSMEYRQHFL